MILYIALIVILSCIALVYVKWQQQKNKFKHIPGHSQLILPPLALRLVHVFPFLKQYIGVTDESILIGSLNKEFGPVAKMQSFGFNVMNISDVDFIKHVATRGSKSFTKEGMPLEEFTNTYFGTSLLSATDNETWQRHHALVSPAFSDGALECVNDATVNSVKRWFKLVEKDNRRDILVDVSKLSLDVIGVAGFGHQFKPFDVSDNARTLASETPIIIRHLLSYISLPKPLRKLPIGWIARFNQALDLFSNKIQKIITEGRKNLDMNGKKDILSLLLRASSKDQEHAPLTDSELISNMFVFIVAGHDTSASTISFALYQLATNPDVLKKAQQQVDQVLGNNDPTYSNFEELTYLQWVVKETLRVNPVVTAIPRITTHQMQWKGFDIPKGTMIFTPFDSHSNPDFFPDPDQFRPERWDNLELKNRFAYTPFGYGNRACIGRKFATIEVVIILAMILQRYDVFVDKDYGEMEISSVITSKPKKDLYITFKPRIK